MIFCVDLFCRIIDNFGDAGFSLRLGRDLAARGGTVRLLCSAPQVMQSLMTAVDRRNPRLRCRPWPTPGEEFTPAPYLVAAFACRLPPTVIAAARRRGCRVINIDYLSAESWVEGCHLKPSYADGIESRFFYPGFTPATGGLIIERPFAAAVAATPPPLPTVDPVRVSVFAYDNDDDRISAFLTWLRDSRRRIFVDVFAGKALACLNRSLRLQLHIGETHRLGNVNLRAVPMLSQPEYDQFLLDHDLNLVRGEDSIVRAMLAGRPFGWQIYPQPEQAHAAKLEALFARITAQGITVPPEFAAFNRAWAGLQAWPSVPFDDALPTFIPVCARWSAYLRAQTSLTDNLLRCLGLVDQDRREPDRKRCPPGLGAGRQISQDAPSFPRQSLSVSEITHP